MADDISMKKAYSAKDVEDAIYKIWMDAGIFAPEKSPLVNEKSEPFSIVLPPPNVTGTLHMGHAAMLAIEDAMVRYARMSGKRTVWIPGTDHAAIATESKVEKLLIEKEQKTRHDLGREGFLSHVKQFAQDSHDTIVNQMKKMGASVDWSREAYTLDEARNGAVRTAFERMHKDGLIYRGHRLVNWDPKGQTTVSDDEVVYREEKTKFYYFQYGPFVIGTARPETKFGDKYVVVHPDDARYKDFTDGQQIELEWISGPITATVIKDTVIDMQFGTGAMTITPWHSAVDFELAQRRKLDMEQIIDEHAKLLPVAGECAGMHIDEAREYIVEKLRQKGLLVKEEEYTHQVATAERTGGIIEPQVKEQWFIDVNKPFWIKNSKRAKIKGLPRWRKVTLKEVMQHVVRSGQVQILPDRFEKTYFHWIDNLRDWNISRQIWFGHQVPVWYCLACEKPAVNAVVENKWFIVRHGQTDWNKEHKLQGQADIPLNDTGREQARKAAEQLKGQNVALIVSSDLGRCKETAEIIAKELGVEVEFDARLRERSFGDYEGVTYQELKEKYQDRIRREEPVETVELYADLEQRISEAFEEHRMQHVGKNVVIVSHGGAIRQLRKHIGNLSHEQMLSLPSVKNAEVLAFDRVATPCASCGSDLFLQDQDTLDTWFSSGLWTFSTLGWPDVDAQDFKTFHPTSVLETGYDILFFWVARMILMSTYLVGEVPFKTVYLHGLVRDDQGRKMSKSLGNIIDPLEMIEKYGADATRLSLLVGATPGNDMALSEEKIAGFRNFTNKLWNIARFVFMTVDKVESTGARPDPRTMADQWILSEFDALVAKVTAHYEKYEYSLLGEILREFTWNTFADWYIEIAKIQKKQEQEDERTDLVLLYVLEGILKLWHPFMPFVTEEIYKQFNVGMLIVAPWPQQGGPTKQAVSDMQKVQAIVVALRNIRAEYKVEPKQLMRAYAHGAAGLLESDSGILDIIKGLGRLESLVLDEEVSGPTASAVVEGVRLVVPLEGLVDLEAERAKLQKAVDEARGRVASIEGRLANKEYVANAPAAVVQASRAQLKEAQEQLEALNKEFERLTV